MQFTRFISLITLLFSFGTLLSAFPVPVTDLAERCPTCGTGGNDAPSLTICANLQVKVKADLAVVASLVAKAETDVDAYTAAFATLAADLQAAVALLVALPAANVGLQAVVIAGICGNIVLDIFASIGSCSSVPNISSCYGTIDSALAALLAQLNICLGGILALIVKLCLSIKVSATVSISLFPAVCSCFGW